ncbi:MAG: hypothetical protein QOK19_1286 [Solirubrobacteraceae bacterium]|nr:hypothetical protein [Solirubrobacteraceae bacterium]
MGDDAAREDPREAPGPPSGIEEPSGRDPGESRGERDPHHMLNNPATDPDPTEWPDPYERRPDPRFPAPDENGEIHPPEGSISTSQPHPGQDLQAPDSEAPERDRSDR